MYMYMYLICMYFLPAYGVLYLPVCILLLLWVLLKIFSVLLLSAFIYTRQLIAEKTSF